MVVSITVGYLTGLLIEKYRGTVKAKITMWVGVGISLAFLVYYKYANFFIENFNAVTGLSVSLLKIALPIGISFYTFQIVSYMIDVYRGTTTAQRNYINLAAYISMFPQLIAGPIVRYVDIEVQLRERKHTFAKISLGIRRFVIGLAKKILVANALGELCDMYKNAAQNGTEISVLLAWIYGIAFSLHIYFDFSGYSDMAIGLGHILGFDFLENFNYPYISASVTEFWRRWHMSLGSWFRDYVYIPMGGNRVKKIRWFFNIFVVWLATGFWHGAAWNFIVWGLMFAVLLVIEKLGFMNFLRYADGGFSFRIVIPVGAIVYWCLRKQLLRKKTESSAKEERIEEKV
jgi:alginate O-acetyltransferase complex protein AlgI